jgi:uncharacterized membrane protein YesL
MDPITIYGATSAITALTALGQAILGFVPVALSVMGIAAEIASRLPKPDKNSSENYKKVYRAANWLGRNVKHAENKDA